MPGQALCQKSGCWKNTRKHEAPFRCKRPSGSRGLKMGAAQSTALLLWQVWGSVQRDPWTMPSPEDNWNKRPSTRQVGTCHPPPHLVARALRKHIRVSKCYFVNVLSTGATRNVHTSPALSSAVLQTTPTHYHQHPVQKYIFFLAALRNHFIMPEPTV